MDDCCEDEVPSIIPTGGIGPMGPQGIQGIAGNNGWTPVLSVVSDGERRVLKIVNWTGGTGTMPSVVNQFVGPLGIVATAALAVNIRGASGTSGVGVPGGGSQWFTAAGAPGTITGQKDGDFYLNSTDGKYYELIGGIWTLKGDLTGPPGPGVASSNLTGEIKIWSTNTEPSGWKFCDGNEYAQVGTYASLYAVIGTTFNTGGETVGYFRVPNLKGKVVVGKNSADAEFNLLGESGGIKEVTLTAAQSGLPAHTHSVTTNPSTTGTGNANIDLHRSNGTQDVLAFDNGNAIIPYEINANDINLANNYTNLSDSQTNVIYDAGHTHSVPALSGTATNNDAANASTEHTNLQPYLTLNYIIKI